MLHRCQSLLDLCHRQERGGRREAQWAHRIAVTEAWIEWPGLQAYFHQGRFVGYNYGGRRLKTTAGLQVGDSMRQARRLYGNELRLSYEQGGAWFARTPLGTVDGFTYGRSGNQTDIGSGSRV